MADHDDRIKAPKDTQALREAYDAKFGDAGDFDAWTMTPAGSEILMREALERGSPPTQEDLNRVYKDLFGEDFPEYPEGAIL